MLRVRQGISAVSSARPQRLPVEMNVTEAKACKKWNLSWDIFDLPLGISRGRSDVKVTQAS